MAVVMDAGWKGEEFGDDIVAVMVLLVTVVIW